MNIIRTKMSLVLGFFFLAIHALSYTHTQHDPLLVVSIMIKNESERIEQTLQPFVDAGHQYFMILDTGSEDDTVAKVKAFFEKHNVQHGYICEAPFVNFAVSRNELIKQMERKFPNACYTLMIDAEWYFYNFDKLLTFCKAYQHRPETGFLLRCSIYNGYMENYLGRVWKLHKGHHFEGVVHEYLTGAVYINIPADIYIDYSPTVQGAERSVQRFKRDLKLFLAELEREPDNSRTTFYTAQTYECLGDLENALKLYLKRSTMSGFDQETFIAVYRCANIYRALGDWDRSLEFYIKAYDMRPCRVEPLIFIIRHYLEKNMYGAAYMFAKYAVEVKYPTPDVLFVEEQYYKYDRYDLLSMCAWYVGDHATGEMATRKALEHSPQAAHLHYNLYLYTH